MELRKLRTKIAVAIWRRGARMIRACTPCAVEDEDLDELEGEIDEAIEERRGHPGEAGPPAPDAGNDITEAAAAATGDSPLGGATATA